MWVTLTTLEAKIIKLECVSIAKSATTVEHLICLVAAAGN